MKLIKRFYEGIIDFVLLALPLLKIWDDFSDGFTPLGVIFTDGYTTEIHAELLGIISLFIPYLIWRIFCSKVIKSRDKD